MLRSDSVKLSSCSLVAAVAAYAARDEKIVVFLSVTVQSVVAHIHEHAFFNVELGHVPLALGDLVGCVAVHAVDDRGVAEEHLLLICQRCYLVVDIREAVCLGILFFAEEDAVLPNAVNGNQIPDTARKLVAILFLRQVSANRFNHADSAPPFPLLRYGFSSARSKCFEVRCGSSVVPKPPIGATPMQIVPLSCRGMSQSP